MNLIHRYLLTLPASSAGPAARWAEAAGDPSLEHRATEYLSGARKWPPAQSARCPLTRAVDAWRYAPLTPVEALRKIRGLLGLEVNAEPLPTGYARKAAERLGTSEATISRVLRGRAPCPKKLRVKLWEWDEQRFAAGNNAMSIACSDGIDT